MFQSFGPLSAQMLVHILLMNALAPLLALAAGRVLRQDGRRVRSLLFPAMAAQLAVLWAWHAPPVLDAVARSQALHLAMQASLFLCALWFWSAALSVQADRRWRAILALLLTSKLFCLLGVLMVFAPRVLYATAHGHGLAPPVLPLADQQLAGLLMLIACPATYLVAGTVIAARWIGAMDAGPPPGIRRRPVRHET